MPRNNSGDDYNVELEQIFRGEEPPLTQTTRLSRLSRLSWVTQNLRGILILVLGYYLISWGMSGYAIAYKWGNDWLNGVINQVVEARLGSFELRVDPKGRAIGLSDIDRDTLEKQLVLISGQYKQCLEAQEEIHMVTQGFKGRLYGE